MRFNKLLAKSSKCYSRTLALGLSQAEVTQLRQRCKEYCRNILHIHPCCADASVSKMNEEAVFCDAVLFLTRPTAEQNGWFVFNLGLNVAN